MSKAKDIDPSTGYGNGAPAVVARYFKERGSPDARTRAEHLLMWLWQEGYVVLKHEEVGEQ